MPSVSITWNTRKDGHKICPICKDMDGAKWTFREVVPDSLIHVNHGEVWNVVLGSLAHEAHGIRTFGACQCYITVEFDLKDLLKSVKHLRDTLKIEMETSTATITTEEV